MASTITAIEPVYGPSKPGGPVAQRFGPINGVNGYRRLNVLFTRAKKQTLVFTSMDAADIRPDATTHRGVQIFHDYLSYAATGHLDVGRSEPESAPESPFEETIVQRIEAIGCEAVPQVGVAGYRVDIGVRHPAWPHGYILGVECDGATYHSARSVRERDRLRQEVLENLGWRLYRIWSTDWFNDPAGETERLRRAIVERLRELRVAA